MIQQGTIAEIFNKIAYDFVPKFADSYQISKNFLGFDLSQSASSIGKFPDVIPYFILVILVGATQYFSFKVMSSLRKPKKDGEKGKDKKKKKDNEPEDFGEIMQRSTKQATLLMPVLLMFLSYSLPSGLSIYLITTSTFVILQQLFLNKRNERNTNINTKK